MEKKLAAVADKGGGHKDMAEEYRGVLRNILKSKTSLAEALKAFAEAMVQENVYLVVSRPILQDFCAGLTSMPDAVAKEVAHFALERLQPRVYRSKNRHVLEHVEGEIINNRLLFQVATLPPFEHLRKGTRVARSGATLQRALLPIGRPSGRADHRTPLRYTVLALAGQRRSRMQMYSWSGLFAGCSLPHQKALTLDGTSILDRAGEQAV